MQRFLHNLCGLHQPRAAILGNTSMAKPKTLFGGTIHTALVHALTVYDRQNETRAASNPRAHYNPYALPQYLIRLDAIEADIAAGAPVRDAIVAAFHGPLLRVALKAVNEPAATRDELTGAGKGLFYTPVAR